MTFNTPMQLFRDSSREAAAFLAIIKSKLSSSLSSFLSALSFYFTHTQQGWQQLPPPLPPKLPRGRSPIARSPPSLTAVTLASSSSFRVICYGNNVDLIVAYIVARSSLLVSAIANHCAPMSAPLGAVASWPNEHSWPRRLMARTQDHFDNQTSDILCGIVAEFSVSFSYPLSFSFFFFFAKHKRVVSFSFRTRSTRLVKKVTQVKQVMIMKKKMKKDEEERKEGGGTSLFCGYNFMITSAGHRSGVTMQFNKPLVFYVTLGIVYGQINSITGAPI